MTEFTTKLHQVLCRHSWNHFWLCDCHSTESNLQGLIYMEIFTINLSLRKMHKLR